MARANHDLLSLAKRTKFSMCQLAISLAPIGCPSQRHERSRHPNVRHEARIIPAHLVDQIHAAMPQPEAHLCPPPRHGQ